MLDFLQFDSFLGRILELPPLVLWVFFCFSNFLENVFPPWPGDTVTVFSGFLSSSQDSPLSFFSVVLATYLGNLLGALVMYYFGERILQFLKRSRFPFLSALYQEENLQKTLVWFRKHEMIVVLLSRFSAGIRFFVSIVAGMSKMNIIKFVLLYSLAISIWCGLLLLGGSLLGSNWNQIVVMLSYYNRVIGLVILCFILYFLYQIKKKRNTKLT
ncbi:DedA family protein [Leptospira sp. 2 VSF19]|uniref:DedA family protein n=1 Tax=Leptospira soteropolitanensis TaxID=2950025 RepID=A0AAW5VEY2_9LEPT|nr:DedA family protein [Leptospira soteropolitanensis]MCW7492033.1 DedA family protein [Leptospira soteropolitanensis]MCW7499615.1 DedA family protein [Leptospira soteropolitanensis]MCW7521866.1 DedA family protein [Leptospira soteropolitanensis]MCW7525720.1 DedA family protein [Leptospira soteropolitanensis]MCW7530166.1 DedA family protein [Leptospira soteropolitanensis]